MTRDYDDAALAYEVTPTGTVTYQWAGGKLLSQRPTVGGASHTYWYLLDSQGNAKALLDGADQNRLKAVYVYDGFGNLQPSSFEDLDIENPLRYRANSGYLFLMEPQQEVEYALYNAGARTYNTDTGRWLQEDPIVGIPTDPMSFNRYLYCNADPINKTDPTGLMSLLDYGRRPFIDPSDPEPNFLAPPEPGPTAYVAPTCPGWSDCQPCHSGPPTIEDEINAWNNDHRIVTYIDINVDYLIGTYGVICGSDGSVYQYRGWGYFSPGGGMYLCSKPTPCWGVQGSLGDYGLSGYGSYSGGGCGGGLGVGASGGRIGVMQIW